MQRTAARQRFDENSGEIVTSNKRY